MNKIGVLVIAVEEGSLADQAGIRPGDRLIKLNGEAVLDQLSYQFLVSQRDETEVTILHPDGGMEEFVTENGGDGLGLDLAEDKLKVCRQNCVFCFVHQMPKGFRKSLYLKDEDIRLSFLYGHFTTLSSSDDAEIERVIRERMSPIHVSVHATDPAVRIRIVGNPKEGDILRKIDRLVAGGVQMHTQVVIAPGINDGDTWTRTIRDLWERRATLDKAGGVLSLSCVPVGLTAHRSHLPKVEEVDPAYAQAWVRRFRQEVDRFRSMNNGEPWLLLADEWFAKAELPVPKRSFYAEDWAQLENGVGLVRRFTEHSRSFLRSRRVHSLKDRSLLLLTGTSFATYLAPILSKLNDATGSHLRMARVANTVFGTSVTVAGLLCGSDLLATAMADKEESNGSWVDAVIVPSASLRSASGPTDQYDLGTGSANPETPFLDDLTIRQLEERLGVPVIPSGDNLARMLDNIEARLLHNDACGSPCR